MIPVLLNDPNVSDTVHPFFSGEFLKNPIFVGGESCGLETIEVRSERRTGEPTF